MLYFRVKAFLIFQEILQLSYYKNLRYALVDVFQKIIYAFINPYRVSKKFLQKSNQPNIHMYGETPIVLFDRLLKKCKLTAEDTFYDLGCGRGRLCIFAKYFYNCKVIGIEQIPSFVKILRFLQKVFRIKDMQIIKKDMLDIDYINASFIYLYGTCLENNELERIVQKFQNLKTSTKILTISFALSDYDKSFRVIDKFPITLPWGKTHAYLQINTK